MVVEARVDYVFRIVSLVGLRDEAAAATKTILNSLRQLGKCVHGKMADEVRCRTAVYIDLPGGIEKRCRRVLSGNASETAQKKKHSERPLQFATRTNH